MGSELADNAFNTFCKRATAKGVEAAIDIESGLGDVFENAAYKEQSQIRGALNRLGTTLRANGSGTVSLGRTADNAGSELSDVADIFAGLLDAESDLGKAVIKAGLKDDIVALRMNVIKKCEADQEYILGFMRRFIQDGGSRATKADLNVWKKELDKLHADMAFARKNTGADIRTVEEMMKNPNKSYSDGSMIDRMRSNRKAVNWNCKYSRFLEEGEMHASRLYNAAQFIAGKRRARPREYHRRTSSRENNSRHLYSGASPCLDSSGVLRFSESQTGVGLKYFAPSWLRYQGGDMEVEVSARWFRRAKNKEIQPAIDAMTGDRPMFMNREIDKKAQKLWEQSEETPPNAETLFADLKYPDGLITKPGNIRVNDELYYKISKQYEESAQELSRMLFDAPTRQLEEQLARETAEDVEEEATDVLRKIGRAAKKAGSGGLDFFRSSFLPTLTWVIKVGWPFFMAYEVFLSMAHQKSGCFLEYVTKDNDAIGNSVKICHDATWGHGPFAFWPNEAIKVNCQSCEQIYDEEIKPKWDPTQIPINLKNNGCTDITNPTSKPCRSPEYSTGYNYRWSESSWFDCLFNTLGAFANDAAHCVSCLTKVAALVFSGGLASVFGIIIVLCIVWVIMWIYRNFFAGITSSGGGRAINLTSSGQIS